MPTTTRTKLDGPIGLAHSALGKAERVNLGDLQVDPERFQVRNPLACSYVQGILKQQESAELAGSLRQLIEDGVDLDPLIVWEDPQGTLWVLDGHHRMEALSEADAPPDLKVWVQRFIGTSSGSSPTEAEARAFALEVNKRLHLNMDPKEIREAYWRGLLCGEIHGSVRGRVKQYGISKSTIERMDKEKPKVLAELQRLADSQGVPLGPSFIRSNAPLWKHLAEWRENPDAMKTEDLDKKAIEQVVRTLTVRLGAEARAQPMTVIMAFEQFMQEATGKAVSVSVPDADF